MYILVCQIDYVHSFQTDVCNQDKKNRSIVTVHSYESYLTWCNGDLIQTLLLTPLPVNGGQICATFHFVYSITIYSIGDGII